MEYSVRKNLHIIFLAVCDFPYGHATTSRVKLICEALSLSGSKVSLGILNANSKKPVEGNDSTKGFYKSIEYEFLNGNTVRPSGAAGALRDTIKGMVSSVGYLRKKKKLGTADLIILYTPNFIKILPCVLVARTCSIPIVLELCELGSTARIRGLKERLLQLSGIATEKLLTRFSSAILLISRTMAEHLAKRGIRLPRDFQLPILVDYKRFKSQSVAAVGTLKGKNYFLSSGTLGEKEDSKVIIDAFSRVVKDRRDMFMVFTGGLSAKNRRELMAFARALSVAERVIFTGFLGDDELVWAYQHSVALVNCRSKTVFARNGFPTKLGEYLATGRPVITTDIGDVRLFLKDGRNAFFCEAENVETMAVNMAKVLRCEEMAERVGMNGQKVAEKEFDYRKMVLPLNSFLSSIVAR